MKIQELASPHKSARPPGVVVNAIVIHDTGGASVVGTIEWFVDPDSKVSSHYLIDKNGVVYQFVPDEEKAWHAGKSTLYGKDNVNDFSIGVELVDHLDEDPYPQEQIDALIELCAVICVTYRIPLNRVVGHEHVAPGRKKDPGRDFPWYEFLASLGSVILQKEVECETSTG